MPVNNQTPTKQDVEKCPECGNKPCVFKYCDPQQCEPGHCNGHVVICPRCRGIYENGNQHVHEGELCRPFMVGENDPWLESMLDVFDRIRENYEIWKDGGQCDPDEPVSIPNKRAGRCIVCKIMPADFITGLCGTYSCWSDPDASPCFNEDCRCGGGSTKTQSVVTSTYKCAECGKVKERNIRRPKFKIVRPRG